MPDLAAVDTPPENGVYVDHDQIGLTDAEAVEGNAQGETVDITDDDDNGLAG